LHARQGLQFDGHMFHDVAAPSAFVESLKKTASFTNAAPVFDHAGQPRIQSIDKAGQRVRGMVLKRAEINPSFDDRAVGPHIGTAQIPHAQNGNIRKCHEDKTCVRRASD